MPPALILFTRGKREGGTDVPILKRGTKAVEPSGPTPPWSLLLPDMAVVVLVVLMVILSWCKEAEAANTSTAPRSMKYTWMKGERGDMVSIEKAVTWYDLKDEKCSYTLSATSPMSKMTAPLSTYNSWG